MTTVTSAGSKETQRVAGTACTHAHMHTPGPGVTVTASGAQLRVAMEKAGAVRCLGFTILAYAPGPGNSLVPLSSTLPNFSRARSVKAGTVRTVEMADLPGTSILK